ncbi:UDP-N-acetylglucosamine transferase subunit ALG13 homolog [Condylostylus longicornis]|uniref:UDP-N-acetylglucosamine transferase subunit ALG13 homolog n=1 Tax=Condylostylus longicornis TaxID=2530218 RepID=UPI00244DDBC1|nr:UDP-N-acetylglucosamine transferase subunit ALG13 homolog [Condylostylus longicornis]
MTTPPKTLVVTVGTTSFDALIRVVDTAAFHHIAKGHGFGRAIFQIGTGNLLPNGFGVEGINPLVRKSETSQNQRQQYLNVTVYRFSQNWIEDLQNADLVIGHAGAGTILEVLRMNKHLLVVINESLMENHQRQIGDKLEAGGYLYTATPSTLLSVFESLMSKKFKSWPKASTSPLYAIIENLTGVDVALPQTL